jgi:hypothetical protein
MSGLFGIGVTANSVAVAQALTQTKLRASTPIAAAKFGQSVAISGNVAVIGAPGDVSGGKTTGAAYVFNFNGSAWVEQTRLTASDGAAADAFGQSVAIDGNVIVVGATGNDQAGGNAGAAYVYRLSGGGWSQEAKLVPNSPSDNSFGFSVDVDADTIAVGAPYSNSGTVNSGSAYVFRKNGSAWNQMVKLATGTGGAVLSDLFGWAVSVSGNTLVVGAYLANAAHVYDYDGATWNKTTQLTGSDTTSGDRFGYSVSIDGATIAVGAAEEDDAGNNAGAAYVFQSNGAGWTQQAKLILATSMPGSRLGWSVAVRGDTLVVGARESKGNKDQTEAGAAYVYKRQSNAWLLAHSLFANDSNSGDHFGASVALDGNAAVIGAPDANGSNADEGAAYVYSGLGSGGPPPTPGATASPTASPTAGPPVSPTPVPTAEPTASPTASPAPSSTPDPGPGPGPAQPCEAMTPGSENSEDVATGLRLTWRGAFRCNDAPDQGRYRFTLTLSNSGTSASPAMIEAVELTHTTPRPRGIGPQATVTTTGVPVTIAPGASASIIVSGAYMLVGTDEGKLANLHFCVKGKTMAGEPFHLGVNALLRGPGTAEQANNQANAPVISNVRVIPVWRGAIIKWATDRPAHGRLLYGPGPTPGNSRSAGCGGSTEHEVAVTGLNPGQAYVFQIRAHNDYGGMAETGIDSFIPTTAGVFTPLTRR